MVRFDEEENFAAWRSTLYTDMERMGACSTDRGKDGGEFASSRVNGSGLLERNSR